MNNYCSKFSSVSSLLSSDFNYIYLIFLWKLFLDLEKGNKIDNSAQIYDRKVFEWFFEKTHCRYLIFFCFLIRTFEGYNPISK